MSIPIQITELKEGDQGIIYSIGDGPSLTSRLAGMGIVVPRYVFKSPFSTVTFCVSSQTRVPLSVSEG